MINYSIKFSNNIILCYLTKQTIVVGSSLVQNRLASTLLFQNCFVQKALKPLKKANNLDDI